MRSYSCSMLAALHSNQSLMCRGMVRLAASVHCCLNVAAASTCCRCRRCRRCRHPCRLGPSGRCARQQATLRPRLPHTLTPGVTASRRGGELPRTPKWPRRWCSPRPVCWVCSDNAGSRSAQPPRRSGVEGLALGLPLPAPAGLPRRAPVGCDPQESTCTAIAPSGRRLTGAAVRRAAAVQRRSTVAVRAEGSSGSYIEEQSFRIERVRV